MKIRRSADRGYFDHGWLKSYHTFSFAGYHDPKFTHFSHLRVINEDVIAPQTGFDFHPHENMEIITYVISGAITHKDNLGNNEDISSNQIQIMSAGSGIIHSEWNTKEVPCHLLQIWVLPNQKGGEPYYKIQDINQDNQWALLASLEGKADSLKIRQDADIYAGSFKENITLNRPITTKEKYWLHVATGEIQLNEVLLVAGDAISGDTSTLEELFTIKKESKLILFYL